MNWVKEAHRYVKVRRKMGYRFVQEGKWLLQFAAFAETRRDVFMRCDTIQKWVSKGNSTIVAKRRFTVLRDFARWLAVEDYRHEVPPRNALRHRGRRRPSPHLLSIDQISALLVAARGLTLPGKLTGEMYYTLFGLMASTGLRRAEAVGLRLGDFTADGLVIHASKFGKSRLIPISSGVRRRLQAYVVNRRRVAGGSDDLFVLATGKRPALVTVDKVFRKLLLDLGIRRVGDQRGPFLHSLRHSFAVRSLEQCLTTDPAKIRRHAYALSVYLGHKNVLDTYWYLEATPTLLRGIAAAAEEAYAKGVKS